MKLNIIQKLFILTITQTITLLIIFINYLNHKFSFLNDDKRGLFHNHVILRNDENSQLVSI